jgi:AraC-like DNA-binding protein
MALPSASLFDASEPFLPGSYALLVLSIVRRWGVTAETLLGPFGLDEAALEAPEARLPVGLTREIVARARELTGEAGLGVLIGLETHTNTYGFLSFATMSATNLGEALEILVRYSRAVTTAFTFRLNRTGDVAALVVDEECDLGEARDAVVLGLVIGLRAVGCALTGRKPWRPIDVSLPEPPYHARFAHLVPEVRFSQPVNQIVLLESDLGLPLLTPDRAAFRLAIERCEHSIRSLGLSEGLERRALTVLERDGTLSFDRVATALGVSPRTLKRRLAESGATFSDLVEKTRRERALLLLRSPDLSLDDVAERLGYSTVSNFVRAFRRWTTMTPSAYRKANGKRLSVHLPLRP